MQIDPRVQRARAAIRRARLHTWSSRLIRWLPHMFWVSVVLFFTAALALVHYNEYYGSLLAIPVAAVILLSGVGYPLALLVREVNDRGLKLWRFSMLSVLVIMTDAAIVMGLLAFAIRHSR